MFTCKTNVLQKKNLNLLKKKNKCSPICIGEPVQQWITFISLKDISQI